MIHTACESGKPLSLNPLIGFGPYDGSEVVRRTIPLEDFIEIVSYDLLAEAHDGWENNDGAYGDFTFDITARTITLDHNSRYTAVETSTHAW